MNAADIQALSPFIILGAGVIALLLAIAVRRHHGFSVALAVATTLGALVALWRLAPSGDRQITPLLNLDGMASFFFGLIALAACAVAMMAHSYFRTRAGRKEEFYVLLVLATLGATVMAASVHMASFLVGLELLSVSLYGMVAFLPEQQRSLEAGIKYLVLASASSAFLVFGMALLYARFATLEFSRLAPMLSSTGFDLLALTGLGMMIVGFGFKLAVVPFHFWTPDVYQGAPAPVTAFVATVSKGAAVAVLLRFMLQFGLVGQPTWVLTFTALAAASMIAGNLLALMQHSIKRLLAYSSIAHLGYVLVAALAGGPLSSSAVAFYMVSYFITTLAAFGVVAALTQGSAERDDLRHYRGLGRRRPWLAAILALALMSLAGIPLTAGFIGKFLVMAAGVGSMQWLLIYTLVASSVVGLFYYLRVVVFMFMREAPDADAAAEAPQGVTWLTALTLAAIAAAVIALGIYPVQVLDWSQGAAASWF